MSKVFKMDKAGREALLLSVATKFAAIEGLTVKDSDRKENYTFLDPVLGMKVYNEGVRLCVQSSAKTVNMCLEIYSRKDDEVTQHLFASRVKGIFVDKVEVAGIKMQWKVIYKGGLLRIAIPSNKTDDEIVSIMSEFKAAVLTEYNAFVAEIPVTPANLIKTKKTPKTTNVVSEVETVNKVVNELDKIDNIKINVDEEPDLA